MTSTLSKWSKSRPCVKGKLAEGQIHSRYWWGWRVYRVDVQCHLQPFKGVFVGCLQQGSFGDDSCLAITAKLWPSGQHTQLNNRHVSFSEGAVGPNHPRSPYCQSAECHVSRPLRQPPCERPLCTSA